MTVLSTRCIPLIAVIAPFIVTLLHAQEPELLWSRTYGGDFWEKAYDGVPTDDGGFLLVGYTESFGAGESDLYIVKVNAAGDTVWTRVHGESLQDEAYAVARTADGGFIVAGLFGRETEESPGRTWLLRIDRDGGTVWQYAHDNSDMYYRPNGVGLTREGNVMVVGRATSLDLSATGGWLMLLDPQGEPVWSKTFTPEFGASFNAVDFTADDGMIVAGQIGTPAGDVDAWLLALTDSGDSLWTRRYGGNGGDAFASVRVAEDSSIVAIGSSESFGNGTDALFVRLKRTSGRDSIWLKTFGGTERDYGNAVLLTEDGGYVIAGMTERPGTDDFDAWIVRANSSRETVWSARYGSFGIDEAVAIHATLDDGYWVVGSTEASATSPADAWLLRLGPDPASSVPVFARSHDLIAVDDPAPNPFDGATRIRYRLETGADVEIAIQDVLGRSVRRLVNRRLSPGSYALDWNGRDDDARPVPAGTYLCVVTIDGQPHSLRRIILAR